MGVNLNTVERPGEDPIELPESLGWLVAACTWVRHLSLGRPMAFRVPGRKHSPGTARRRGQDCASTHCAESLRGSSFGSM